MASSAGRAAFLHATIVTMAFGTLTPLSAVGVSAGLAGDDSKVRFQNLDGTDRQVTDLVMLPSDRALTIRYRSLSDTPLFVLFDRQWIDAQIEYPSLIGHSFDLVGGGPTSWYRVRMDPAEGLAEVQWESFRPQSEKKQFTFGSARYVLLERPMFVNLVEVPHIETRNRTVQSENGTTTLNERVWVQKLGIDYSGEDRSGQRVIYNSAWLESLGFSNPWFMQDGGEVVWSNRTELGYLTEPKHFSVIWTFEDSSGGFSKQVDYPYSDVSWNSYYERIDWTSDRRDGADEIYSVSRTSVSSSSQWFRLSAKILINSNNPGNWVGAYPLALCPTLAPSGIVGTAGCMHFRWIYASGTPSVNRVYLEYRDGAGVVRVSTYGLLPNLYDWYPVEIEYANPVLKMRLWNSAKTYTLASASYTTGTNPNDGFSGVRLLTIASDGNGQSAEPVAKGSTDDVQSEGALETNILLNPSMETDSNGDGIPNNWIFCNPSGGTIARVTSTSRSGIASVRVDDYGGSTAVTLCSDNYAVTVGRYYSASAWLNIVSVTTNYVVYLEFLDAALNRVDISSITSSRAGASVGVWKELRMTKLAPPTAVYGRLYLYSHESNTGAAYWDDAELRQELYTFWSVNLQPTDDMNQIKKALDHIAGLGARHVRVDVAWDTFENSANCDPDPTCWPQATKDKWAQVVDEASMRGLDLIVILGHLPTWAKDSQYSTTTKAEWQDYCYGVALLLNRAVYYYQILNEENHVVHGQVNDVNEGEYYSRCYDGLVSGEGTQAGSASKSKFKTIANAYVGQMSDVGWLKDLVEKVVAYRGNSDAINILAIDHYPGSWSWSESYTHWDEMADADPNTWDLAQILLDKNKEGAVMETGFPSPVGCATADGFINDALPVIKSKTASHNSLHPNNKILLANWYRLVDELTGSPWTCNIYLDSPVYEKNFGVMQSTWANGDWPKEAAFDLLLSQMTTSPPI